MSHSLLVSLVVLAIVLRGLWVSFFDCLRWARWVGGWLRTQIGSRAGQAQREGR